MLGCFSHIVAKDAADENVIWVTEAWVSVTSHEASLTDNPFGVKCLVSSQISCRHFRPDGCHLSNCGIPVETMDISFQDKSSKHNIHCVKMHRLSRQERAMQNAQCTPDRELAGHPSRANRRRSILNPGLQPHRHSEM